MFALCMLFFISTFTSFCNLLNSSERFTTNFSCVSEVLSHLCIISQVTIQLILLKAWACLNIYSFCLSFHYCPCLEVSLAYLFCFAFVLHSFIPPDSLLLSVHYSSYVGLIPSVHQKMLSFFNQKIWVVLLCPPASTPHPSLILMMWSKFVFFNTFCNTGS